MLKDHRKEVILKILEERGTVDINSIANAVDSTPITIRRDLTDLEKTGLVERVHGGARLIQTDKMAELPYDLRNIRNKEAKEAIAKKAAGMIQNNMTVVIDSGTTTVMMANYLNRETKCTVITNSIELATGLMLRPAVRVITVGGEIRKETHACSDDLAQNFISSLRADIAFLGITALDLTGAAYNVSIVELGIKAVMQAISKKVYILADSSKIGDTSLVRVANIANTGVTLITDEGIPKDALEKLRESEVDVIVAESFKN